MERLHRWGKFVSNPFGSNRIESDRIGSDRIGSDRISNIAWLSPEFEEHNTSSAAAQPVSLPHQHHITTATAAQSNMMLRQGAQPSLLAPPAAANSLPQTANRQVQLSRAAGQQLIELHQAENRLLQPLEAQSCAGLIGKLQGLAVMKFGAVLRDAIALSALEVSRHLPGAHGWPSAEGALGCLQLQ